MILINKLVMPLSQRVAVENAIAKAEKNKADIEYVAMMTDVDLDEDEATKGAANE